MKIVLTHFSLLRINEAEINGRKKATQLSIKDVLDGI